MVQAQDPKQAARMERAKRIIQGLQERTEDRGCTEAEAMEAAAKIGELLAEFELNLTDVGARDTSNMVKREVYAADDAAGSMVTGISRLCSLQTYRDTAMTRHGVTTYVMFGHSEDVELAMYLYEVCVEAVDHGWAAELAKHGHQTSRRMDYRTGFAGRMYHRMFALREQRDAERRARMAASNCTDLVVLKDQIVATEFGKTGVRLTKRTDKRRVKHVDTYYRGSAHADTVNLNNPLQDQRERAAGLL